MQPDKEFLVNRETFETLVKAMISEELKDGNKRGQLSRTYSKINAVQLNIESRIGRKDRDKFLKRASTLDLDERSPLYQCGHCHF